MTGDGDEVRDLIPSLWTSGFARKVPTDAGETNTSFLFKKA
jgi:hypothetical protein